MSTVNDFKFYGTRREFDEFLRFPLRVAQMLSALVWTLPLLWFQLWWWLPIPLALSFLLYEYFFYARADRAIALTFSGLTLQVVDDLLETATTHDLSTVHSAVLMHRKLNEDITEAVLALSRVDGPLITLQFRLPPNKFTPHPTAIDGDLCNGFLGAIAGMVRALAPREVILRQIIEDPRPLAWFYLNLPPDCWRRSTVRVWRGEQPDLDLFGYHSQPHDGLVTLDERGITLQIDGETTTTPVGAHDVGSSMRTAVLFQMDGEKHAENEEQLPLMLQKLGGNTIAIPAPLSAEIAFIDANATFLHVHAPEGAVILWWLWTSIRREDWPEAWVLGLRDARVLVDKWPTALPTVYPTDDPEAEV